MLLKGKIKFMSKSFLALDTVWTWKVDNFIQYIKKIPQSYYAYLFWRRSSRRVRWWRTGRFRGTWCWLQEIVVERMISEWKKMIRYPFSKILHRRYVLYHLCRHSNTLTFCVGETDGVFVGPLEGDWLGGGGSYKQLPSKDHACSQIPGLREGA